MYKLPEKTPPLVSSPILQKKTAPMPHYSIGCIPSPSHSLFLQREDNLLAAMAGDKHFLVHLVAQLLQVLGVVGRELGHQPVSVLVLVLVLV
jgi:hypothetical protein